MSTLELSQSFSRGIPAIIGGTGLDWSAPGSPLQDARDERVSTRFGTALVTHATFEGRALIFLHRHAAPDSLPSFDVPGARVPPHAINYRANIAALKKLGATAIFASTAVGSLRRDLKPGALVVLDDFLDLTTSRAKTFFDAYPVHVDVTNPYCPHARSFLLQAARDLKLDLHDGGTYACTDGPRFETPREIQLYASWGADVVGMTGVPEVVLAREAQISYAGLSIVTNLAAGISPEPLTQGEVLEAMRAALPRISELFLRAALAYTDDAQAPARRATREFATPHFEPDSLIV
jgi:5'-methylthioadenosine phosphorylase